MSRPHPTLAMASCIIALLVGSLTTRAAEPAYAETTDALKQQVEDVFTAVKVGDKEKAAKLIKWMMLPEPEAWFKQTFGDTAIGKKLLEGYKASAASFEATMMKVFEDRVKDGRTFPSAFKIEGKDDPNAARMQVEAMAVMQQKTALYTVKLGKQAGATGFSIWSWVYVDGQFRLVGKMKQIEE